MPQNICNICGGNYILRGSRWVCPYCGAYKPEELSPEEDTLLVAAAQKLRIADFDEAEKAYDDIVEKYPQNHAGYWGRLLARFGIKYEDDFDGKKIPTCYATSIRSISDDRDYAKAIEFADAETKEYYRRQANYIERVRKEWVEKASKEAPYDIFICYKDSDLAAGMERTSDSVAAQELYIHLKDQGYRVFYSRESLRNKVGEKYEPYIFGALASAKVMIVYGSSSEYITSTWLKNEWLRYAKRMKAGEKQPGSLIVAYEGFNPAELPSTLSSMQCMDAAKKTFFGDLDGILARILRSEPPRPVEAEEPDNAPTPTLPVKKKIITWQLAVALPFAIVAAVFLSMYFAGIIRFEKTESNQSQEANNGGVVMDYDPWGNVEQYYTVFYNLDGGINSEYNPVSFLSGSSLYLENPTREGYEFTGWKIGSSIYMYYIPEAYTTSDITVTACWNPIEPGTQSYNLTYRLNGGNITLNGNTYGGDVGLSYTNGDSFDLPIPTREHYTFAGWAEGSRIEPDMTGDKTFTALWTPIDYPVTYHLDGGTNDSANPDTISGEKVIALQNPTKEGYDFEGWYVESCGFVTSLGVGILGSALNDGEINVYAKWTTALAYSEREGGGWTVTGLGTFTGSELVIPEYYQKKPVYEIAANAFADCTKLISVSVGERVEKIGTRAFSGCTNLKEVSIPSSVNSIGTQIFFRDTALETLYYDSSYYDSNNPFLNISSLRKVVFGGSYIPNYLLENNTYVTEIVLNKGVETIQYRSFAGCTGIKEIRLPTTLKYVNGDAFDGCTKLSRVDISDLKSYCGISFSDSSNPLLYAKVLYLNGEKVTDLVIPEGVEILGEGTFTGCESLTSVSFPTSLSTVSASAFAGCKNLREITIPSTIDLIGEKAFQNCTSLTGISIPDSITALPSYVFGGCTSLASVSLADSLLDIGQNAFSGCTDLKAVTIPSSVKKIQEHAFANCTNLKNVYSEENSECTIVDHYAFSGCASLARIDLGDSLTTIGHYAFDNCTSLASVTLGDSLETVGYEAFCGCASLASIDLGDSLTKIEEGTFSGCTSLASIDLGDSLTTIGNSAFYGCASLASIDLGDSITEIGLYAFKNCTSLASIDLGDSLTTIGDYAFYNCASLASVTLGDSLETVGYQAFYGCTSLASIDLGDSLTTISYYAFSGCTSLASIDLGDSLTTIGEYAFLNCPLESVTFGRTKAEWHSMTDSLSIGMKTTTTVYCSDGNITYSM